MEPEQLGMELSYMLKDMLHSSNDEYIPELCWLQTVISDGQLVSVSVGQMS